MILIISKEKMESSTEIIMQWLHYMGADFYRMNGMDMFNTDRFNTKVGNVNQTDTELSNLIDKANIVWSRRWSDKEYVTELYSKNLETPMFDAVSNYLISNMSTVRNYFLYKLRTKKWLSHPAYSGNPNKLIVLDKAQEIGLCTPKSAILSNKQKLIEFQTECGNLITKDLDTPFNTSTIDQIYFSYTSVIDDLFIKNLPENFGITFFQEKIDKKYELRIFFLDGILYPMAIFSQSDEQTQVDFRKYNKEKPNRNVPYNLPTWLSEKLLALMRLLKLDTGSIDMIKSCDNEYVFLEVNPVGQFGMTSHPCNYFIEKKIAAFLIKNDKKQDAPN